MDRICVATNQRNEFESDLIAEERVPLECLRAEILGSGSQAAIALGRNEEQIRVTSHQLHKKIEKNQLLPLEEK